MAGIKFLTYNGKKLPIKLGIYTMMLVQEKHGIVMGNEGFENVDGSNLAASQYIPLLYSALEQGHLLSKKPFDIGIEYMHDILNECLMEFIEAIPSFFPEMDDMLEKLTVGAGAAKNQKAKSLTTQSSSGKPSPRSKSGQKKS